jgi:hypothetical protein
MHGSHPRHAKRLSLEALAISVVGLASAEGTRATPGSRSPDIQATWHGVCLVEIGARNAARGVAVTPLRSLLRSIFEHFRAI